MFERLGSLTYRFRFLIVLAWVAGAAWSVLFAPSLAAEGMTDQTAFLPPGTASMEAHDTLERAFPGSTSVSSTQLVFARDGGLSDADHAYVEDTAAWIASDEAPEVLRDAVADVETAASRPELASLLRSEDGELEMVNVNLDVVMAGSAGDAVVSALREHFAATAPAGLAVHVTGAGGIGSDYLAAIVAGTDSTTIVTILLVVIILLLIYRAPLAAMVPLVTIGAAFIVARGTLGILALMGWKVSSLIDTFIVVLIFGVGTDYAIFLISRFREEVAKGDWHDAARTTVGRIGAVISASAATVIVGLGAMAFGDFGMIQTTGPALAVGVAITLVAGLTLTPALLGIFGHYLFWPRHTHAPGEGVGGGIFGRLATMVSRRPALVTAVLLVVLFVPALYLPQMRTNFDVLAELPASSDARAGFDAVAEHLGRGEVFQGTGVVEGGAGADLLEPTSLSRLLALMQELDAEPGVASVTSLVTPEGDGALPDAFRPSWQLAEMADAFDDESETAAPADAESVLDPDVTDGLDSMATYLGELGAAFPDVAYGPELRAATAAVMAAQDRVETARDGAIVSTQLRALASAMTSPAAMAGGSEDAGDSIGMIGDYLDELVAAYPDAATQPAFADAKAAAARLENEVTVGAAVDLAAALRSLATHYDDRPDATLFPESLAGTDAAKEARREIETTFEELPASLDALAAVFATRADDVFLPTGLGGEDGEKLDDAIAAFVSGDRSATRFYLSTSDDPYSQEAFATVARAQEILEAAAPGFGVSAEAHLGGTTAQFADVQAVLASDFTKVGIITVLGILLVLVILLRAIVAPLYLVGTVLLSCATALGLSSWFFQEVLGHPGVSFYLPILVFVLLVAIGSDYNIFLVSRIREESEGREIHEGIRIASARTGAVITSAGLILAGTFAAMMTADLVVLFQVGAAVAVGVLIDTFLVRSVLVPAITTLFGERAWWPSGWAVRRAWPVAVTVPAPGVPAPVSRRRLGVALAVAALVPLLVGGVLAWSLNDPSGNLDAVTAAVVDLDEGAAMPGPDGTALPVDLGAEIADRLAAGTEGGAFAWVAEPDPGAAEAALENGTYGAVLTIPEGFSASIAGVVRGDPGAQPARLHLATDDASGYALGSTARSVVAALAAETGHGVTADAVDRILLAVGGARSGIDDAAADVHELASRTTGLADDAAGTAVVADELVAGLAELADGMAAAGDGVDDLAGGVRSLADGTDDLADGTERLATGLGTAADGAGDLADGVQLLAAGLRDLAAGVAALPAQVSGLAAGTEEMAQGASLVATGGRELADNLALLQQGTTTLGDDAVTLDVGARYVAQGAAGVAAGAETTAQTVGALAGEAGTLQAAVQGYTDQVATLAAGCPPADPLCAAIQGLAAGNAQLNQGAAGLAGALGALAGGLADPDPQVGLAAGAAGVAAGAADVATGTGELATQAPALQAGIAGAAGGADQVADGAEDLASGATELATGTALLAASMPALAGGVDGAADAATELASGADSMAGGMATLAAGADALGSGARTAATGASRLADGTSAAADGASQIVDAMDEATEGARLVATEAGGLADDGTTTAADAAAVAAALETRGGDLPAYAGPAREAIGSLVAAPIAVDSARLHPLATDGAALAPLLLGLSLWVGALAAFLVLPAFLGRRDPARWWRRALSGYAAAAVLGGAQALLVVLAIRFAVGVEVARLPELVGVAVLAALAFVAVNQALVALFDYRGWLVSIVLLALQVAAVGALYPAATAPELLQVVRLVLPLTFAVDAFRALIAGGGADLGIAVAGLVAWGIAAILVTLAVAHRSAAEPDTATIDETALAGA